MRYADRKIVALPRIRSRRVGTFAAKVGVPSLRLVAREESQLRQVEGESRWSRKDGVWVLRTTRQWLARDLDLLKPIFDRMRVHGVDLLDRNTLVADELRRTFHEIDRMEKEIGKAAKAPVGVGAGGALHGSASRTVRQRRQHEGSIEVGTGRQQSPNGRHLVSREKDTHWEGTWNS